VRSLFAFWLGGACAAVTPPVPPAGHLFSTFEQIAGPAGLLSLVVNPSGALELAAGPAAALSLVDPPVGAITLITVN
jgi:hypothetical protein